MTCRKTAYRKRRDAMTSVTWARARGYRRYAYKCPKCKSWHLGTGDHRKSSREHARAKAAEERSHFPNLLHGQDPE